MTIHVFECGGYGIVAPSGESALEILRENEGDDVADWLAECRVWPVQLDAAATKTIDMSEDEEPRLVTKTCAEWIASATSDIVWRPE